MGIWTVNMDFSAKISNMIKICKSDQNVEFRLKMKKIIKIWNLDRNMEFCSNFNALSIATMRLKGHLDQVCGEQSFLRLLHESESCVELVYSNYDLYTILLQDSILRSNFHFQSKFHVLIRFTDFSRHSSFFGKFYIA